jgi:hypothetical protein
LAMSRSSSAPPAGGPTITEFLRLCGGLLPGTPAPAAEDNLFELGADSLVIAAIAAEVRTRWSVELDPGLMFLAEDIAEVHDAILAIVPATAGHGSGE